MCKEIFVVPSIEKQWGTQHLLGVSGEQRTMRDPEVHTQFWHGRVRGNFRGCSHGWAWPSKSIPGGTSAQAGDENLTPLQSCCKCSALCCLLHVNWNMHREKRAVTGLSQIIGTMAVVSPVLCRRLPNFNSAALIVEVDRMYLIAGEELETVLHTWRNPYRSLTEEICSQQKGRFHLDASLVTYCCKYVILLLSPLCLK